MTFQGIRGASSPFSKVPDQNCILSENFIVKTPPGPPPKPKKQISKFIGAIFFGGDFFFPKKGGVDETSI